MHQSVLARQDIDERPEVHQLRHSSPVYLADFNFRGDVFDAFARGIAGRLVAGINLDVAVVVDIDGRAGLVRDRADGGAALADNVPDLVRMYFDGGDAGGIFRHFRTRPTEHRVHPLKNMQPACPGLGQGHLHDLPGNARHLDIHLQRADAGFRTGHLEIHIAEMVFITHDVRQHHKFFFFLDQAHGDAGHGRSYPDARVHQRQACAADRGHGTGAVRFRDLGHDPDGIGKLIQVRHNRHQGALGQPAVADLAPFGRACTARFTHAIRREVVMQHERVLALSFNGINDLCIPVCAQGSRHQRLGLTTGKQGRAVRPGQHAHFHADIPYRRRIPAVDTRFAGDDCAPDDTAFQLLKGLFYGPVSPAIFVLPGNRRDCRGTDFRHPVAPADLVPD